MISFSFHNSIFLTLNVVIIIFKRFLIKFFVFLQLTIPSRNAIIIFRYFVVVCRFTALKSNCAVIFFWPNKKITVRKNSKQSIMSKLVASPSDIDIILHFFFLTFKIPKNYYYPFCKNYCNDIPTNGTRALSTMFIVSF